MIVPGQYITATRWYKFKGLKWQGGGRAGCGAKGGVASVEAGFGTLA